MTKYLVDNSVLQRLPRSVEVRNAVARLLDAEHEMCSCAVTVDEAGYSARSLPEYLDVSDRLRTTFLFLPMTPAIDETVVALRTALFSAGMGRAAGVVDVQIAATAVVHRATVLHYDSDYDDVSNAYPGFSSQWIVPRGTID